jgi:predicted RNase H-like HicB family nuclease
LDELTAVLQDVIISTESEMERKFPLEYWIDDGWHIGRLKEIPEVFSQGADLPELEENISEAYRLVVAERDDFVPETDIQGKELSLPV